MNLASRRGAHLLKYSQGLYMCVPCTLDSAYLFSSYELLEFQLLLHTDNATADTFSALMSHGLWLSSISSTRALQARKVKNQCWGKEKYIYIYIYSHFLKEMNLHIPHLMTAYSTDVISFNSQNNPRIYFSSHFSVGETKAQKG